MSSKKFATQKIMGSYAALENDAQSIVKVSKVRGGNLVDVETESGSELLCEIPSHFTKKVWIKRGDFLIVELYDTDTSLKKKESKIKAFVVNVLQQDSIKHLKQSGKWPTAFEQPIINPASIKENKPRVPLPPSDEYYDDDDDLPLPVNPNRPPSFDSDSENSFQNGNDEEAEEEEVPEDE